MCVLWFTSMARPLDLDWATNRLIAALAFAGLCGGALTALIDGAPALEVLLSGAWLGTTVLFAWATARELDPDGEAAAFVAVLLVVATWFVRGTVNLWALTMALMLTRMVARTVGPSAQFGDALAVFAAAGVGSLAEGRWALAAATALAFGLDALLPEGRRSRLVFAVLAAAAAVASFSWSHTAELRPPSHGMSVAVVAVLVAVGVISLPPPISPCDDGRHRLRRSRIQAANVVALALFVLTSLEATPALPAVAVGAVLVGTTLGRVLPRARVTG
jgi:hypothetical protein